MRALASKGTNTYLRTPTPTASATAAPGKILAVPSSRIFSVIQATTSPYTLAAAGMMEFGQIMSVRDGVFSWQTQVALYGVRRTHVGFLEDYTRVASHRVSAFLTHRSG